VGRPADIEVRAALRRRALAAGLDPGVANLEADTLIASALDPEPLVVTSRRLLAARPAAVRRGFGAAALLTGAGRLVLAVPMAPEPDCAAARRDFAGTPVEVAVMPDRYPTDAADLAFDLTGRLPDASGRTPGVAVVDLQTLLHLDEASRGEPITHRAVTVTGAVRRPRVLETAVGTSVGDLVAAAGGAEPAAWLAFLGGPLTGRPAAVDDVLTPADDALCVLALDHPLARARQRPLVDEVRRARGACEACGACTAHCPRALLGHGLAPHEAVRAVAYLQEERTAGVAAATLCAGCGVCEIVCPIGLSPRRLFAGIAAALAARGVPPEPGSPPRAAHPERAMRRLTRVGVLRRLALEPYAAPPPWEPDPHRG